MIPKNWEELLIRLAMQFPVLGACTAAVWCMLRWTTKRHQEEINRQQELNALLLAEKEKRVARIEELKADIDDLKRRLRRTPPKEKAGDGGTKPRSWPR